MSTDVLGTCALNRLRERLEEGVVVLFVYRRVSRNDARNSTLVKPLEALESSYKNFKLCNAENHAKLLVHDDLVVVSSLNFLSFGAEYEDGLPSRRRRIRSELGLAVTNSDIADPPRNCATAERRAQSDSARPPGGPSNRPTLRDQPYHSAKSIANVVFLP